MDSITTCHDCGMVQQIPDLPVGTKAVCSRCDAVLSRRTRDTVQQTLALALTGLVLFVIANGWPFLSMRLGGQVRETTLVTGIIGLWNQGMAGLSILVLLTSIVIPLVQLLGLLYLLFPILVRGCLARHTAGLFRFIQFLRPWSMMEVFLLAILVAMIKLTKMADIVPGVSLWAFALLVVVLIAAFSGLNPDDIWQRIHLPPREDDSAHGPLVPCHACAWMSPEPLGHHRLSCPRCHARLRIRKPASIQRTWALVTAAVLLYVPANLLPITHTSLFGTEKEDTIISGVIFFMMSGSWHIALIIFVASVLIPLMKLMILIYLLISVQSGSLWKRVDRTRLYRFTEAVGRWSMVDVYVVTVLVALVQLGSLATVKAGPGAVYFAAVVVVTMFAAKSFDARLIWDKKDDHRT